MTSNSDFRREALDAMSTPNPDPAPPDFDALWDYSEPAKTEAKFRELLQTAEESTRPADWRLELLTQIARTQGLQRKFEDAHRTLDELRSHLAAASLRVHVRYLLERGRVFNSAKERDRARILILEAWHLGRDAGQDGLAVDAAHMLGIIESPEKSLEWNQKALRVAEASSEERARNWRGSLHNNIGWSYFERDEFETALRQFQRALQCRVEQGDAAAIRVAKWCVAKGLRATGRVDEALKLQTELHGECSAAGKPDGYVDEELGECLMELNRGEEAQPCFAEAFHQLSHDSWLCDNEPARMARLKQLGQVSSTEPE